MINVLRNITTVILLILFLASHGTFWGVLDWVIDKRVDKIERKIEQMLDVVE